jgi:hypothetical protein
MTLNMKGLFATLSINGIQQTDTQQKTLVIECHYAECRDLFFVMLNVVMLSDVMLKVVLLLSITPLSRTIKNATISTTMLNAHAECHYAECLLCYVSQLSLLC